MITVNSGYGWGCVGTGCVGTGCIGTLPCVKAPKVGKPICAKMALKFWVISALSSSRIWAFIASTSMEAAELTLEALDFDVEVYWSPYTFLTPRRTPPTPLTRPHWSHPRVSCKASTCPLGVNSPVASFSLKLIYIRIREKCSWAHKLYYIYLL